LDYYELFLVLRYPLQKKLLSNYL
ncbi:hypothetical protein BAE44_0010809, partial [Dichanthelium oligosanthes]